ncbi:MAG TPA: hypothetical protein VMU98_03425 [Acidimicrobiales bacterium]|nr:hypothetical protein [Acidimicrobiales bacterium]
MRLRRVVVDLVERDDVAAHLAPGDLLDVNDADATMVLASLREPLGLGVGLWLRVDEHHPAALVARDVATLSRLRALSRVVIEASDARSQAEVVRALLSPDEVNFANEVATLRGAYNRPAPPAPLEVGYCEGARVTLNGQTLGEASRETFAWGEIVTYA